MTCGAQGHENREGLIRKSLPDGNCAGDLRRRAADFDYRCEANHLTAIASTPSIGINLDKTRPIDRVTSQLRHSPGDAEGAHLQTGGLLSGAALSLAMVPAAR